MKTSDFEEEKNRYEIAYSGLVETKKSEIHQKIFLAQARQFKSAVEDKILDGMNVLELAAGDGSFTQYTLNKQSRNIVTDISLNGLKLIETLVRQNDFKAKIEYVACDMQNLPFAGGYFDVVIMTKSLSYGTKESIAKEVSRVLKYGGLFIILDQIYDNPIYSFNRWVKYKRGSITKSSFTNRPKTKDLELMAGAFQGFEHTTYGIFYFLYPIAKNFITASNFLNFCHGLDRRFLALKSLGFTVLAVYFK